MVWPYSRLTLPLQPLSFPFIPKSHFYIHSLFAYMTVYIISTQKSKPATQKLLYFALYEVLQLHWFSYKWHNFDLIVTE